MKYSLAQRKETDCKGDNSTTEESSEDDLSKRSVKSKSPYKPAEPENMSSSRVERPAIVSARSPSSSSPQPSDHTTSRSPRQQSRLTRGESDDETPNVIQRPDLSGVAKPKHRLGKIGGKNQIGNATSELAHVHNRESTPHAGSDTEVTVGKSDSTDNQGSRISKQSAVAGARHSRPQPPSPPQITEEQADKNRKRLQQDLESRSKMGNKKKRKF